VQNASNHPCLSSRASPIFFFFFLLLWLLLLAPGAAVAGWLECGTRAARTLRQSHLVTDLWKPNLLACSWGQSGFWGGFKRGFAPARPLSCLGSGPIAGPARGQKPANRASKPRAIADPSLWGGWNSPTLQSCVQGLASVTANAHRTLELFQENVVPSCSATGGRGTPERPAGTDRESALSFRLVAGK